LRYDHGNQLLTEELVHPKVTDLVMRIPSGRLSNTPAAARRARLVALEAALKMARAEFLMRHPVGEDYVPLRPGCARWPRPLSAGGWCPTGWPVSWTRAIMVSP
jgi:hypothetical protein